MPSGPRGISGDGYGSVAAVGLAERPVYRLLPGDSRVTRRKGTGSGFQPAMVRAHSRATSVSVIPGNSRRNSTAAENSPSRSNTVRIASASASVTTNIPGAMGTDTMAGNAQIDFGSPVRLRSTSGPALRVVT
jgi:hypothetical protein